MLVPGFQILEDYPYLCTEVCEPLISEHRPGKGSIAWFVLLREGVKWSSDVMHTAVIRVAEK
jgi:hypothetical protein